MDAAEREAALRAQALAASGCARCGLAATRARVVYGEGPVEADLMLVGESPGFHEDRQGTPFAGRGRELLGRLLRSVGIDLGDVYLATALKCRVPGNREPLPEESFACEPFLYPLFHPAAALYTPTMLEVLERDIARLPVLLDRREAPVEPLPAVVRDREPPRPRRPVQLGLF